MAHHLVSFDALSWEQGGHPLEHKRIGDDPQVIQLRFEPGFEDPNWCTRSHVLSVLSGTLSVDLDGETIAIGPGAVLRLETGDRHRAANRGSEPVILLAISDLTFA